VAWGHSMPRPAGESWLVLHFRRLSKCTNRWRCLSGLPRRRRYWHRWNDVALERANWPRRVTVRPKLSPRHWRSILRIP
jgi:hypothetical protein